MDSLVKFFRRLRSVAQVFRFVEFCVVLVFFSWLSTRLPFLFKISGEYFWKFFLLILSPISIFLLGNAIVVALLAKSGLFSSNTSSSIDNALAELYEEFRSETPDEITAALGKEEIVYQDKQIICEENTKSVNPKVSDTDDGDEVNSEQEVVFSKHREVKSSYQRSQSENSRREIQNQKIDGGKLRRSETDICRKIITGAGDESTAEIFPEDDLSNEEFQRTIEEFIAKQVRFHREERLAVVLHGQA